MKRPLVLGAIAFGVAGLQAANANAQIYNYFRGPNYVDMGGTRCVVANEGLQNLIFHEEGDLYVSSSAVGNRTLYCPISRRSLSYYTNFNAPATPVNVSRIYVSVRDGSSSGTFSCTLFAKSTAGSIVFGTTKYACSSSSGCTTSPGSAFVGSGTLDIASPLPVTDSVQWGMSCSIPPGSTLYGYEATVNAN